MTHTEIVNILHKALNNPKYRAMLPIHMQVLVPKTILPGSTADNLMAILAMAIHDALEQEKK